MLAKRSALALALALVGAPLAVPGQVFAQQQPPAVNRRAATPEEANTYVGMASINMCALSQANVPFKDALGANIQMLVSVFIGKHGGLIPGAQEPIKPEQLADRSVPPVILNMDAMCGKNLSAAWKKEFDPLLARVKQAVQSSGQPPRK